MVISEGEKLISAMADSFKQQCTLKMTQRSKETFGEAQFTQGMSTSTHECMYTVL